MFLGLFAGPAAWGWTKSPVIGVILGVLPALVPIAFIALHVFVSVVQTYVGGELVYSRVRTEK